MQINNKNNLTNKEVTTKPSHKAIALFFIFTFLQSLLPHHQLWANNNGPNAPEAMAFEPVDATDMVNLATGDMSYVLPILNVPSPEGGYPLALSYHAGIAMDQQASWVGLGWSLNPGAINRSINGFPDDWKDSKRTDMIYNIGGESTSNKLSLSVGWGGNGKYSVGLYSAWGENRAFGGETSSYFAFGAHAGFKGKDATLGINAGSNGIGISYASNRIGGGGISLNSTKNGLGISLTSTSGGNFNIANVGTSKNNNSASSATSYSQSGSAIMVDFSLYFKALKINLNYSKSPKLRYWNHDKKTYTATGTLYSGQLNEVLSSQNTKLPYLQDFDAYEVKNNTDRSKANYDNNLTNLAFDHYSIAAQGLSATMSPVISNSGTIHQMRRDINTHTIDGEHNTIMPYRKRSFSKSIGTNNTIHFYMDNEYSSYLSLSSNLLNIPPPAEHTRPSELFDGFEAENSSLNTSFTNNGITFNNYNENSKRITKGSYIETFTNKQILNSNILGFTNSLTNRDDYNEDGIGGFKITTSDGKTYFYTIPVYQKEKFDRSSSLKHDIEDKFFEQHSLDSYATHWLLTAIVGPDYIDTNGNYIIDKNDYGYWVNFDYGKWTDGYTWRTPLEGYEFNEKSKSYGWGSKEIYYLDRIKTRTHTALFVKEARKDNKSSKIKIGNSKTDRKWYTEILLGFSDYNMFKGTDNKIYKPGLYENYAFNSYFDANNQSIRADNSFYYNSKEQKTLRLKEILLLNNSDIPINFSKANGEKPIEIGEMFFTERQRVTCCKGEGHTLIYDSGDKVVQKANKKWKGHYYQQIMDESDVETSSFNLREKAIQVIDFKHDYSLLKNTPNSEATSKGRLTLTELNIKGKAGNNITPPYKFDYYNSENYNPKNRDDWGYTKNNPASSSLKSITNPLGGKINIEYETDDYYEEASISKRVYENGLQFKFYNYNNKLRFDVEKAPESEVQGNFSDYFNIGTPIIADIWACLAHEYNDWGCKSRSGSINIPLKEIDVVTVSDNKVTFETSLSYTSNHRDGLNWLYDAGPMGNDFSRHIMQNTRRGACPDLSGGCSNRTRVTFQYKLIAQNSQKNLAGGGLRVKKIGVFENDTEVSSKTYYYNIPNFDQNPTSTGYKSSGTTSYAPSKHDKDILYLNELPSPGIVYKNVKVLNSDGTYNLYDFKGLDKAVGTNDNFSMGDILKIKVAQNADYTSKHIKSTTTISKINIKKYEETKNFGSIGRLIKVASYNSNDQLLRKVVNSYKTDFNAQKQGVVEESFNSYKYIDNKDEQKINYNISVASIKKIPSVLRSTTTFENGYSFFKDYNSFDFNTGEPLDIITTLSNGTTFKTRNIPAYTIPEYSGELDKNEDGVPDGFGMGSKVDNPTNKNMLTQQAINLTQIKGSRNQWKTTSANITTWNKNWLYRNYDGSLFKPRSNAAKIWRKHKNYVWKGPIENDGAYAGYLGDFDNFNWIYPNEQTNLNWTATSTINLYNHFSSPLETIDINGNKMASVMNGDNTKVEAVANAGYTEIFYSGAENRINNSNFLGKEIQGANYRDNSLAHTGQYSLKLSSGDKGYHMAMHIGDSHRAGDYKISVWINKANADKARIFINDELKSFNGESITSGNWIQLNHYESLSAEYEEIYVTALTGSTLYADDFRIHPLEASMTSYVYNEWGELSYIIGANNLATKYEYDAAGRLFKTYNEVIDTPTITGGFKEVSKNTYHYKTQ
ncbi:conserved protein of unknown function [Tenacibaculum sp. 190524A02b]|uniref:YD repeat-containing protein n=1 Tax=Tenacibaculum vairaonense TaxID=3137860 RepID=A0ABM9PK97_9FLAO